MEDGEKPIEAGQQEWERAVYYAQTFIIPLLQVAPGELSQAVADMAGKNHEIPHSRRNKVSESTLWRMLGKYQEHGMDGLCRKPRSDAGRYRILPPHILKRALEIRADLPSRSVRRILTILAKEFPLEIDQVKRSTLCHALASAGCSRVRPRRGKPAPQKERHIQMRWERPLQLVQSDVCGQTLWVTEKGKSCKVSLMAVVDHCSKLCLHGEWFLAANLPALEKSVSLALMSYGNFERLHVDHGAIYESYLLTNICSELGISLKFTKPGYAPGKGGIERYWLTVEEDFIPEVGDSTRFSLAELNSKYRAWQHESNHERVHSATGEAPVERYQRLVGDVRFPDPVRLYRAGLLREKRTVDKRFCTVRVRCQSFVVHPSLKGKDVQVRYDPFTLTEVLVYDAQGKRFLQKATPASPNEQPASFLPDEPAHRTPSIDVLTALEADHAKFQAKQRDKAAPSSSRAGSNLANFCRQVAHVLKRESWSSTELSTMQEHWERYGPFKSRQIRQALEPLVLRVGHALHLQEYLMSLTDAQMNQESEDP